LSFLLIRHVCVLMKRYTSYFSAGVSYGSDPFPHGGEGPYGTWDGTRYDGPWVSRLWTTVSAVAETPGGEGCQGDFEELVAIHEKSQPETGKGYGEGQLL
jgi:hypothetical protein